MSTSKSAPKSAPTGLTARAGALSMISAVLDRGTMLDESGLKGNAAERAEARGLADVTLRRLGQIDGLLANFVQKMPPPSATHALRLMAAELVFAGTAPHAAVDLAVRLAKRGRNSGRLGGLVNAVGRRLAGQGAALATDQDAARLNTPDWLWQALEADWGATRARAIAETHLIPAPHDLTMTDLSDAEPLAHEVAGAVLPGGSVRLSGRPQISTLPGYQSGAWWAQDAAAAMPVRLIAAPEGKRVLDLCAAPGGKTLQLAAAGAKVTALDISARRMKRLDANLTRIGLEAEQVVADALTWEPAEPFDVVLVDAPCSASGTLRRHPDVVRRQGQIDLGPLIALQRQLLSRAAEWVAPGGHLIFCTCSLFRAEGEEQAEWFLGNHGDFTAGQTPEAVPEDCLTEAGAIRTLPDLWHEAGGIDGFFAAGFRKAG